MRRVLHSADKAGRGRTGLVCAACALALLPAVAAQSPTLHMRYERAVQLPADAAGTACVVLDAATFAHAASRSADDLRLYAAQDGRSAAETPFSLVESEASLADDATAKVEHVRVDGHTLRFDLAMPPQVYSTIELDLAAKDFVGRVTITGGSSAAQPAQLGVFTIFDLSAQRLPRSTSLALAETHDAVLHGTLDLWRPDGRSFAPLTPALLRGATVPPSREAQTLYTPVASASLAAQQDASHAALLLPAHVPVERVRFVADAAPLPNFERSVLLTARPTVGDRAAVERVQGMIAAVLAPAHGAAPALHYSQLAIDAALGANLRSSAVVQIAVPMVAGQPLPLRGVVLEMRRRSLCFQAQPHTQYTLRYGDEWLPAPVYANTAAAADLAPVGGPSQGHLRPAQMMEQGQPLVATLGPEQVNPQYRANATETTASSQHPPIFWAGLFAMLSLAVAVATHRTRATRR